MFPFKNEDGASLFSNKMAPLILGIFCNFFVFAFSDKVLRVVPSTISELQYLKTLKDVSKEIDFWRFPSGIGQPVDFHLNDIDYNHIERLLRHWGLNFTVRISGLNQLIDLQRKESIVKREEKTGPKRVDFHKEYHSLYEINNELRTISDRYRKYTSIVNIGESYENRSIIAIKIQGKLRADKPLFFIQCGIHAREWIAPATCMYVINKMTSLYHKSSIVTAVLDKMDLIVLPVVNVDGYEYTWSTNRLWRKNRRPNQGSSCIGTDLNRNWENAWGGAGSSDDPCDGTYRGTKPFSEPETLSIKTFLKSLGPRLQGFLDMHSYSQMWFIPWGHTKNKTKDFQEQMRIAEIACRAVLEAGASANYTHGPSARLMYKASGIAEDWVYGNLGIRYSFSVELRDTGHYGFLLPATFIHQSGDEMFHALNALVMAITLC